MKPYCLLLLLASYASADKPAVPPAYQAPAAASPASSYAAPAAAAPATDSYGSPVAPAASSAADSYGSPAAPPQTDTYGSPAAPVVDEYGSPAATPTNNYAAPAAPESTPVGGNQGYYYYYYPVKQNAAAQEEDDGGLLGGLGSMIGALLGKKVLVIALIITGLLVLTALGINVGVGRAFSARGFSDMAEEMRYMAEPYMTPENLSLLANYVERAINQQF